MAGQAYLAGYKRYDTTPATWPSFNGHLESSGLTVYLDYYYSSPKYDFLTSAIVNGYAVTPGSSSDLAVTLPANSLSYVYFVLDMAGGGTNTISQRLVYYNSPAYASNAMLIAEVVTDASSVSTTTYRLPTRWQGVQAYPAIVSVGPYALTIIVLDANTERTTTDTTGELVKQFCVEYAGVYTFSCELKNASLATTTCYVYAASTGDTHGTSTAQLTFTDTNATYTTNTGTLALSEGDVVSVYLKTSNATYAGYIDQVSIVCYACVPLAPAFQIE